jgi:hypothetical protein
MLEEHCHMSKIMKFDELSREDYALPILRIVVAV